MVLTKDRPIIILAINGNIQDDQGDTHQKYQQDDRTLQIRGFVGCEL